MTKQNKKGEILLEKIRQLKKELEMEKNNFKLQIQVKEEELKIIKEMMGGKVKTWDRNYDKLNKEKKDLKEKVKKLEGNLYLVRRDGSQRLEQLKRDKKTTMEELHNQHQKVLKEQEEKLDKEKEDEIKTTVSNMKAKLQREMEDMIENQKKIWIQELEKKEEELAKQRKKWQQEFENQRIEFEKREKEYLEDLLNRFK